MVLQLAAEGVSGESLVSGEGESVFRFAHGAMMAVAFCTLPVLLLGSYTHSLFGCLRVCLTSEVTHG